MKLKNCKINLQNIGGGNHPPPLESDLEKVLEIINPNTELSCAVDSESAQVRNADILSESIKIAGMESDEIDSEYFE